VVLGAAAALSACASTNTSCPLNNESGYCASVGQVHDAAVAGGGDAENVMAGSAHGEQNVTQSAKADGNPLFSPGPGHGLSGPIFKPATPRRLWVAPWTDANGTLHSGEYLYFLSPGHWRYGPLKAPGAASGVMGPVAPQDLGFTPGSGTPPDPNQPGHIQQPDQTL